MAIELCNVTGVLTGIQDVNGFRFRLRLNTLDIFDLTFAGRKSKRCDVLNVTPKRGWGALNICQANLDKLFAAVALGEMEAIILECMSDCRTERTSVPGRASCPQLL